MLSNLTVINYLQILKDKNSYRARDSENKFNGKIIVKTIEYLYIMIKHVLITLTFTIGNTLFLSSQSDSLDTNSTVGIIDTVLTYSFAISADTISTPGTLSVTGDSRLSALIQKHIEVNQDDCPNIIEGYRVQVFSSSGTGSSQKAREARTKFLSFYPGLKAYTDYEAPNFRVRVGDYRTKLEAEKIKKMISQEFPACFIVPDYINTELTNDACQE